MSSLLERLRGATPEAPRPVSLVARLGYGSVAIPEDQVVESDIRGRPVQTSTDLKRILALPRRAHSAQIDYWTNKLRRPGGTMRFQPLQAIALQELSEVAGALDPIRVGGGKTLLDALAAMAVPRCQVAVLLIPPNLREQFGREWEKYDQHFTLPNLAGAKYFTPGRPTLHVVAYSELSSPKATDLLERIQPDLIIADEAHNLRRREAARTKRFLRYFTEHPETRFACWSGTLTSKSIKDYAHLARLALGKGSPVPLHWPTVEEWAAAIDPVPFPTPIGALRALCQVGEHVRSGFRRRLVDTPGVVASAEDELGVSLVLGKRDPGPVPPKVFDAIAGVQGTWQRPDGEELVDALSVSRCVRELSAGFFLRWRWPRREPEEVIMKWLEVRKNWHRELREKLKYAREHLDSPLLCAKAAIRYFEGYRGELPTWRAETWREWVKVRDTAKPETEVVWVDEFLMRDAAAWLKSHVGIAWYDSDAVGKKLASLSGAPFYGPGDEASAGIAREKGDRAIIASIRSHGTGKNLQSFSRNLIVQTPSSGATVEQLLGRTHRQGQEADEVEALIYRHTAEVVNAFESAVRDAEYISESLGTRQKLTYASRGF